MFSSYSANGFIKLILHGTPFAQIADNAAANPATQFVLALHSQDPGPDGTQETFELNYGGYQRRVSPRTAAAWPVVNNVARPSGRIEFAEMISGVEQLATWMTIGLAETGAGQVLLRGRLSPDIQCRLGVIPAIRADSTITFVTATP